MPTKPLQWHRYKDVFMPSSGKWDDVTIGASFIGQIKELYVFNRPLTHAEISAVKKLAASSCPEGTQNAEESQCADAVKAGASKAGYEVLGDLRKGSWSWAPPGCSYNYLTQVAMFNTDPMGSTDGHNGLACDRGGTVGHYPPTDALVSEIPFFSYQLSTFNCTQ